MIGAVAVVGVVGAVVLVGVGEAKDSQAPTPQPDLGDPVASLTCPPLDQIGILLPFGSFRHPSANLAVQEFVQRWAVSDFAACNTLLVDGIS